MPTTAREMTSGKPLSHFFDKFPTLLMSVGKTNDDGNVSIFASDSVTVHKEEDVLITCKGAPIVIGVRDE